MLFSFLLYFSENLNDFLLLVLMLTTAKIYEIFLEEKNRVLQRFKEVDLEHFYFIAHENTWSPEMIFRHLIMSGYWMLGHDYKEGKPQSSKYALQNGLFPKDKATIEGVEEELHEITEKVLRALEKLSPDDETKLFDSWWGNIPRQETIVRMILHDYGHLAQIVSLFKLSTGWTDKEIYGLDD